MSLVNVERAQICEKFMTKNVNVEQSSSKHYIISVNQNKNELNHGVSAIMNEFVSLTDLSDKTSRAGRIGH